jgi:NAD kinase
MATARYENVIIVTRNTELDDLVRRFNTRAQAKFYLQQAGQSFDAIQEAHDKHQAVLKQVGLAIPNTVKSQTISRELVPRFMFGDEDLVITVGQDGLVSNTAKYLDGQPILAVNPDPDRFDGLLLPFTADTVEQQLYLSLFGSRDDESVNDTMRQVTMARASMPDGQSLLAFNDFFIGANSHVSARYTIEIEDRRENQSSSGIIVSTGAGSTGWLQSVYAGAAGVIEALGGRVVPPANRGRLAWDSDYLVYSVREPFPSKATQVNLVHGTVDRARPLRITSRMPTNGVIFSDGIESDYLEFNSGAELTIDTADTKARLIAPPGETRH